MNGKQFTSDTTLIKLNFAIEDALREYVSKEEAEIWFELPDPQKSTDGPVISVFLYDIQEDLQMRNGEARQYRAAPGGSGLALQPSYVNVRCCYLVTYWEFPRSSGSVSPLTMADSPAMIRMNSVLNALLNNRTLQGLPESYTRIIPPSEELNSLGNFWQSIGNKPRLSLSYAVTVPIHLSNKSDNVQQPIISFGTTIEQAPGDLYIGAAAALWDMLCGILSEKIDRSIQEVKFQLSKVIIECVPVPLEDIKTSPSLHLMIAVFGITHNDLLADISDIVEGWVTEPGPVCEVKGVEVFVEALDPNDPFDPKKVLSGVELAEES